MSGHLKASADQNARNLQLLQQNLPAAFSGIVTIARYLSQLVPEPASRSEAVAQVKSE